MQQTKKDRKKTNFFFYFRKYNYIVLLILSVMHILYKYILTINKTLKNIF